MNPPEKLNFRQILPIFVIVFVDLMGLTIIIPILPYFALSYDAGPAVIGLLAAAYPLMQLIGGPILSTLSDRFGRKPILAFAQLGTFLSLLLLGFSNALWMVFLARILDGITGANLPTVQAAISDVTTEKTRAQGLGLIGAAFGLGFILGPGLAGAALALSGNDYSAPAFIAAGFAFLSMLLTTFVFRETLPPEKRGVTSSSRRGALALGNMWDGLREPVLGVLFGLIFLQQLVFSAFQIMFAPFTLNRLGLNSVGNTIFFVYFGVVSVVVQGGLIGRLTRRFGERRLILAGIALVALGLVGMSTTPQQAVPWFSRAALLLELQQGDTGATVLDGAAQVALLPPEEGSGITALIWLLVVIIPLVFGASVLQPSINSLITQKANPRQLGSVLGISSAFLSLANVIGPLWGGAAFDLIGPYAPFLIGGGVMSLVTVLAAWQVPKPQSQ